MNKSERHAENENGLKYYFKEKWKFGVTLFCLFSFITMGIHLEISGSTMSSLSIQVGANLSQLSWILAARSSGFMITVILFGVIFPSVTKHHSEVMLAIGYLLPAAATALTPYLKSLWTLCIALLFQGMLHGISDLAINTLVTQMWLDRSTAPLNCVYFGYAVGALLSIVIVRSFRRNDSLIDKNVNYSNSAMIIKQNSFQSELIGPYTIASIFCLISAIGFGLIAYKQNKSKTQNQPSKVRAFQSVDKEELKSKRLFNKARFWRACSPTTCGQGYLAYGFILISLLLLFNFFFGGIEQGFSKFFISFIEREQTGISKKNASYTMIFYWVSLLIGRILSAFITALWMSPHLMLFLSLFLCLLTYVIWFLFIWYIGLSEVIIFILVAANGLFISSISPTQIGWMKQFLSLSPIELAFILSSNAIGGSVLGLICGYVFEHYGSKHLFTVLLFTTLICFILFILSFILQKIHSKREKINVNEDKILETFIENDQEDELFSSDQYRTITYVDE